MAKPSTLLQEQGLKDDAFREGHQLCPGCLEARALHAIGRATDNGRKTILSLGTFCSEASTLRFPDVIAWGRGAEEPDALEKTVGLLQAGPESAVSVAEGVRAVADLLALHGAWNSDSPNIVAITTDAGGLSAGLDALIHTLHRGQAVTIFALLHEVFGASRFPVPATSIAAGADPVDHLGLALASGAGFVAQVSPAFPALFAEVAQAALSCGEAAIVFVPAPCMSGWRIPEGTAARLARLQSVTGLAPCFRKQRGRKGELLHLEPKGQRPRVEEYLAGQQRFDHLVRLEGDRPVVVSGREAEVAAIQAFADRNVARLELLAQDVTPARSRAGSP